MPVILLFSMLFSYFSEASLAFLTINPGARAVAMGSAYTALADDATAVFYNPAGLAFQRRVSVLSMNSTILFPGFLQIAHGGKDPRGPAWLPGLHPGMRYYFIGAVLPLSEKESVGFGNYYINKGKTEARDENGIPIGEFESYDHALIFSYGRELFWGLGAGVSMKYIKSLLCSDWILEEILGVRGGTATAFVYDWGILYQYSKLGLSCGISFQNLGSEGIRFGYMGDADPLPKLFRIGISHCMKQHENPPKVNYITDLVLSIDKTRDLVGDFHESWWGGGAEVTFLDVVALRGGYFYDDRGQRKGFTSGIGIYAGALEFSVANDEDIYGFPTENWRFQLQLRRVENLAYGGIRNNESLNMVCAGASSLVFPGAGQFYNGDELEGFIFSTAAIALGEIYFNESEKDRTDAPQICLGILHVTSILDAVLQARKTTD